MHRQSTSPRFTQLRHGLLEFVVLTRIDSREGGFYAKELLDDLEKTEFATPKGTLYPLLAKIKRENLVVQSREESEECTPRKFYYLTPKGKHLLRGYRIYWKIINNAMRKLRQRPT